MVHAARALEPRQHGQPLAQTRPPGTARHDAGRHHTAALPWGPRRAAVLWPLLLLVFAVLGCRGCSPGCSPSCRALTVLTARPGGGEGQEERHPFLPALHNVVVGCRQGLEKVRQPHARIGAAARRGRVTTGHRHSKALAQKRRLRHAGRPPSGGQSRSGSSLWPCVAVASQEGFLCCCQLGMHEGPGYRGVGVQSHGQGIVGRVPQSGKPGGRSGARHGVCLRQRCRRCVQGAARISSAHAAARHEAPPRRAPQRAEFSRASSTCRAPACNCNLHERCPRHESGAGTPCTAQPGPPDVQHAQQGVHHGRDKPVRQAAILKVVSQPAQRHHCGQGGARRGAAVAGRATQTGSRGWLASKAGSQESSAGARRAPPCSQLLAVQLPLGSL